MYRYAVVAAFIVGAAVGGALGWLWCVVVMPVLDALRR